METNTEEELVEITFTDGHGRERTNRVYPEVAAFIVSRKEAQEQLDRELRRLRRARQQYIWDREDEFYAAHPGSRDQSFDDYTIGRQWDREQQAARTSARDLESRYHRFMGGAYARRVNRGDAADDPNSWEILCNAARAAGHKIIVWICENCLEYEYEAEVILKYLPATPEELWAAAKDDHEMCQVFDRFMLKAEQAGFFKEEEMPHSVRERLALASYIRREYGGGGDLFRNLLEHIRPVVKAEVAEAVAQARAEWDQELLAKFAASKDMAELLQSLADGHPLVQEHLNRSEAAKAAWQRRRAAEGASA